MRLTGIALTATLVLSTSGSAAAFDAYATNLAGELWAFDTANPAGATPVGQITGLAGEGKLAESVRGIDFRPATGALYALGSTGRIYTLDTATAQATLVGNDLMPLALDGSFFGFDFNPVADRIRITSDTRQNLRAHPDTGSLVATDSPLSLTDEELPLVVGSAYTNNFAGAISTTLYDIDARNRALLIQNPPNDGVLTLVGGVNSLGVTFTQDVGFDIITEGDANHAFAIFNVFPPNRGVSTIAGLYTIDLATGAATFFEGLPANGGVFRSLAIVPAPGAALVAGLSVLGLGLRRRR